MTGWTKDADKINAFSCEGRIEKTGGETASGEDGLKKAQHRTITRSALTVPGQVLDTLDGTVSIPVAPGPPSRPGLVESGAT